MFYYTCDNCHYTFESDKEEYTCPECNKSQISHKFGSVIIPILPLRQANEIERDIYIAEMGKLSDIPSIKTDLPLILFCNLENCGIVFSKIGKSEECNYSKGEKYPYKLGLTPYKPSNSFTFEPINIAYKYIHYGDNLVVLSFSQMWEQCRNETLDILSISENSNYKGCFQANMLFVTEIVSLNSERAIDIMIPHLSEKDIEPILANYYNKGEIYYKTTCYLEKQLRNRFPVVTKQHTLSGDVECNRGHISIRKKYTRKTIDIDYVKYRTLKEDFNGDKMPAIHDPIELNGVQYINVELDQK